MERELVGGRFGETQEEIDVTFLGSAALIPEDVLEENANDERKSCDVFRGDHFFEWPVGYPARGRGELAHRNPE